MTPIKELHTYLGDEMSLSYWSDEGIEVAAEQIARFQDDEWAVLREAWRERASAWQLRGAETLDHGDVQQGIPLLLELLAEGDHPLAQQTAHTPSMRRLQAVAIEAGPPVHARRQQPAERRPGDAPTSRALLARIRSSAVTEFGALARRTAGARAEFGDAAKRDASRRSSR